MQGSNGKFIRVYVYQLVFYNINSEDWLLYVCELRDLFLSLTTSKHGKAGTYEGEGGYFKLPKQLPGSFR